jgi:hypothetical protein
MSGVKKRRHWCMVWLRSYRFHCKIFEKRKCHHTVENVENGFSLQPTLFVVGSLVENGSLTRLRAFYSQLGMGSVYKMNRRRHQHVRSYSFGMSIYSFFVRSYSFGMSGAENPSHWRWLDQNGQLWIYFDECLTLDNSFSAYFNVTRNLGIGFPSINRFSCSSIWRQS